MRRIGVGAPAITSKHATLDGFLLGTPPYMSPEQARGDLVDHRADVWALGVLAYHLLTNEFPFDAETPESMLAKICSLHPTPITVHRPELPRSIARLFERALANPIQDRFQTTVDFASAFELAARDDLRAITVPPDERGPVPSVSEHATLDEPRYGTMIAAGVPQKRKLAQLLLASLFVLGLVGALGGILFIYFEPAPPAAATTTVTMAVPPDTRSVPPPPEPAVAAEEAVAPAAPVAPAPVREPAPSQTLTSTQAAPIETAPTSSAAPRSYDRSELF